MSLKIGPYEFQHVRYDEESDVLYTALDEPGEGIGEETPEGHVWRFDRKGNFYGITFISPRYLLQHEGILRVTLPSGKKAEVQGIDEVIRVSQPA